MVPLIHPNEVKSHYLVLDTIGCLGTSRDDGYLRAAYSEDETRAMRYIERQAAKSGAQPRWDDVGNLTLEWSGSSGHFIEVGSHLDTVPFGGNFDGAAGIVSGLLAIEHIVSEYGQLTHGIRLRVWRAEESGTFGKAYIGSEAALGKLNPKVLENRFNGISLHEAIESQGHSTDSILRRIPTISNEEVDGIKAHLELHIEQSIRLEREQVDIGVVTSIRGPRRFRVIFEGIAGHSGGTPMGTKYRSDAGRALMMVGAPLDKLVNDWIGRGHDITQTFVEQNNDEKFNAVRPETMKHGMSMIASFTYFNVDIRSSSSSTLDAYEHAFKRCIDRFAKAHNVQCSIEFLGGSPPLEILDPHIQDILEGSANSLDLSNIRLPSGAGHDAAVLGNHFRSDGQAIPVGMVFIPCRDGISHNPAEFTTFDSIANGANVLMHSLLQIDSSK